MAADNEINTRITATTDGFDTGVKSATSGVSSLNQGILSAVANAKEAQVQYDVLAKSAKTAGEGMNGLSLATAGASRELIVMGHEVISGNFSRIPGSLMVLGERMGGLSLATMGWGAAIGGTAYVLYELAANAEQSAEAMNQMNAAMQAQGRFDISKEKLGDYVDILRKLPGINRDAAEAITRDFSGASDIGAEAMGKLIGVINDYAYATNQDATKASQQLVRMLEDPKKAADELSATYSGILTPAQYELIAEYTRLGDKQDAVGIIADALAARFKGLRESGMTPAQEGAHMLGEAFSWVGEQANNMLNVFVPLEKAVGYLGMAFKDTAKAAKDVADKASMQGQVEVNNAINNTIIDGLKLREKLMVSLDQEGELRRQLKVITDAENSANLKGDSGSASKLKETENLLRAKIQQMEDRKKPKDTDSDQPARDASAEIAELQNVENQKYQIRTEYIRMAAQEKQISISEEYAELQANLAEEHNSQTQSYQQQLALWQQGSREYDKIKNQMALADQKYELTRRKTASQGSKEIDLLHQEEFNKWQSRVQPFQNAFSSAITGMITGTKTFGQAMMGLADAIIGSFVDMGVQMATTWLINEIMGTESAKTVAASNIAASGGETFAATFASISAIPIIGPELAPEAAAGAAAAAVSGGMAIASAAGGWEVPHDTLAMVHKDEKILPAAVSKKIDDWTGDKGGGDTHVHFNISAIDGKSVKKFFANNSDLVAQTVGRVVRNNNRGLATT